MWTTLLTILYTLLVVGVVVVILTGGDDIYRMFSWLMVVLFLPVVGVVLYLLFGRSAASMRLIPKDFLEEINHMPVRHTDFRFHRALLEDPYYSSLKKLSVLIRPHRDDRHRGGCQHRTIITVVEQLAEGAVVGIL